MKRIIVVVLGIWLAAVVILGAGGVFVTQAGVSPLRLTLSIVVPLVLFLAAYLMLPSFRALLMAADLPLLTAVQAWRCAGFVFLALYAYRVLPGVFAWPAGLGDMAIGFTAPWVALALIRQPGFAARRWFVVWNVLGISDLVVAVTIGRLSAALTTGAAGEITTAPLAELPLLLIPGFAVPLFMILHLTALFQPRRLGLAERMKNSGMRAAA